MSSWLKAYAPRLKALVQRKEAPDDLWIKCPACSKTLFRKELQTNKNVCPHCQHHMRLKVHERLESLFDAQKWEEITVPDVSADPLKFKDKKKYSDRLKEYQDKTKAKDAILVAKGEVEKNTIVIVAFNFNFMGGSMGMAVGEGILAGARAALKEKCPLLVIPASGGARMQEGILSLMQMPRSTIAVDMLREEKLPYWVLLTDPTTGGVSASFAMLGDITIAEPGATIGFAGKRVIQETIRESLPEGFQTAEYLLEHGIIDAVVPRKDLRGYLGKLLNLVMQPVLKESADG